MVRPVTNAPTLSPHGSSSNVEVSDAERVVLNELAPRLDDVAHEPREYLVGDIGLRDLDPEQRAVGGVQGCFPELLGVHFAESLVALDRQALSPRGEHRIEKLGRASDGNPLLLGFRLGRLLI